METLFLSSAGIKIPTIEKEFLKILPKKPKELTLVHITTAANVVTDREYIGKDRAVMKRLGFTVIEYDLTGKEHDQVKADLSQANIIYVQGGNGFYLLKQIKDTGFESIVKDMLTRGIVYVGVSAGTYVVCPTIEMHTWKREVDNMYGLDNLQAMNLVPFLISVHYNREKYRELVQFKIPAASFPVKILTDEQALLIQNNVVKLVGDTNEITLGAI